MKNRKPAGLIVVASMLALGLTVAGGSLVHAGGGDQLEKKVKKVKVIKAGEAHDCEGEDCPEPGRHRIIIKKAGDGHEIHEMMGEECEGDCIEKIIIKKDGDLGKLHAMAGHHIEFDDEECENEDCKKIHRVIVKKGDHSMKVHSNADHEFEWTGDDCEGEDCREIHRIIMRKHGDHHGPGSHGYAFFGEGGGEDHFQWFSDQKGGFLGIQLTELTAELRDHFGVPSDQGVMVGKVLSESSAETAGVEVGDIVTSVNEKGIGSAAELSRAIGKMEAGASVDLGLWRDGSALKVTAVLGERRSAGHRAMRKIVVRCEDGDEDCDVEIDEDLVEALEFDCGGAEECQVEVECEDDECTCTANGEPIDCGELNLPHHHSD